MEKLFRSFHGVGILLVRRVLSAVYELGLGTVFDAIMLEKRRRMTVVVNEASGAKYEHHPHR